MDRLTRKHRDTYLMPVFKEFMTSTFTAKLGARVPLRTIHKLWDEWPHARLLVLEGVRNVNTMLEEVGCKFDGQKSYAIGLGFSDNREQDLDDSDFDKFLAAEFVPAPGADILFRVLYDRWQKWCREVNRFIDSKKVFSLMMKKRAKKKRVRGGIVFVGWKVKSDG